MNKVLTYAPHFLVALALAGGVVVARDMVMVRQTGIPDDLLAGAPDGGGNPDTDQAHGTPDRDGGGGVEGNNASPGNEWGDVKDLPDLDRVVINTPLSPADRLAHLDRISNLAKTLRADPSDFQAWLELASYRKLVEDYDGARAAWEYMTWAFPADRAAFANLGNLYHFYLSDFPQAERYMLGAIERETAYANSYLNLFDLYRLSYAAKAGEAPGVLLRGIEAIQDDGARLGLVVVLADYYAEKGEKVLAREQYEKALTTAKTQKDTALEARIAEAIGKIGE